MPDTFLFWRSRGRILTAALLLGGVVWLQAVSGTAVDAQVPATPTPFRFLTPTPFVPSKVTTTTTTTAPAPRAGGFPMELALPSLAGGVAALSGGVYLLRRKLAR